MEKNCDIFYEKKFPSKILFVDVIEIPNYDRSCHADVTALKRVFLGCTGQIDLKSAFLFLEQRKVKNQEDFLVVEVGQRNSGHSDEYRCKILKIYVQIFERFLDLILTFMTTKYFVLTTFSTPISLWFSRNSKLNI